MKDLIKFSSGIILFILLTFGASYLLKGDFHYFMTWWFVLFALGIIFLPLTNTLFEYFYDKGYLFSKTIGLAIAGYLMWFMSSLKILKFTSASCIIVVLLCILGNLFIYRYFKKKKNVRNTFTRDRLNLILTEEIMFFLLFLIWVYIRGFKPEAHGTEKFMDFGFMTAMMRAEYMPPKDLWFAGNTINYYYVGQYLATFMTKLSQVSVNVGYNLMLMTISALGFMLPFSILYNVTINYYQSQKKKLRKVAPIIAGLLAGSGVSLAGNLHFTVFYYFVPILKEILGLENTDKYWFPNSTRYIGYHPETKDKTIHEFPNYSFVLGDLHAHVINLIFVLTVIGILYAYVLYKKNILDHTVNTNLDKKETIFKYLKEILNPHIIIISFFIGLFHTTNFWDFPFYYVVAGAIILFMNMKQCKSIIEVFKVTALQGLLVIAMAKLIALPFTLRFDQIATDIQLSENRTPIYQLIILWGLPILMVSAFLIHQISTYKDKLNHTNNNLKIDDGAIKNHFLLFINKMNTEDLFILTIGLCAIGLVLIPEIIYVKDIYSGDYKRATTKFKLTYQAFTLFAIAMSFIFIKFIRFKEYHWNRTLGFVGLILFLLTIPYAKVSISAWYGNIFKTENYKGIDAAKFMETSMADDHLAVTWMNENIKGTPVILEANGDSYSDHGRISVITGLPTVLGWYVHEWLWRGDTNLVDERVNDIKTIYTSKDYDEVQSLIDKYDIEYIYVGKLEYDKFTAVNDDLLKSLGDMVFYSPKENEKYYESYLIKLKK